MKKYLLITISLVCLCSFDLSANSSLINNSAKDSSKAEQDLIAELAECYATREVWSQNTTEIEGVLNLFENQNEVRLAVNKYRGRSNVENYKQITKRCVEVQQKATAIHQYLANQVSSNIR